ncbi:MAG: hypothetical protein GY847_12240 [Proteobacteria bacterium]|nr:hypothetical protein [Pseudomonadota bacterium]
MKNLILALCLGFAIPMVGCAMLKQSNAAHHAIEDHNYDVEKVVVKVKNGHKTAVVHSKSKFTAEDREKITAIVMEEIPDAEGVTFQRSSKVIKGKPVKK